jgi:hypothetical protein
LTQRLTNSLWHQKLSSLQPFFKGFCTFEQVALINTIAVHIWQQSKHCIVGLLAKQNYNNRNLAFCNKKISLQVGETWKLH